MQEKRASLGYTTCVHCGGARRVFTVAPAYNKGAYQLISINNIKDIGRWIKLVERFSTTPNPSITL